MIYTLEMVGKIIGLGFIMHEHAYLKDAWNWLDFIVVLMGLVSGGLRPFSPWSASELPFSHMPLQQ